MTDSLVSWVSHREVVDGRWLTCGGLGWLYEEQRRASDMNFLHRILIPEGMAPYGLLPTTTSTSPGPAVPQEGEEEASQTSTDEGPLSHEGKEEEEEQEGEEEQTAAAVSGPTGVVVRSPKRGLGMVGGEDGNFTYPLLETGEVSRSCHMPRIKYQHQADGTLRR